MPQRVGAWVASKPAVTARAAAGVLAAAAALAACQHPSPKPTWVPRADRPNALAVVLPGPAPAGRPWHRGRGDAPETGPITELVVCGGHQQLDFVGRAFRVDRGPALLVGGSCMVTLTDCTIIANHTDEFGAVGTGGRSHMRVRNTVIQGDIGLSASGSSTVDVEGGSLVGDLAAIAARSDSIVSVAGAEVGGNVSVEDRAAVRIEPAGDQAKSRDESTSWELILSEVDARKESPE